VRIRHVIPLIFLSLLPALHAATLSITVHDPSGALVQSASVTIQPARGGTIATFTTGPTGTAAANDLASGDYRLTIDKTGFARFEKTVTVTDAPAQ
jgi:hypothetical protein